MPQRRTLPFRSGGGPPVADALAEGTRADFFFSLANMASSFVSLFFAGTVVLLLLTDFRERGPARRQELHLTSEKVGTTTLS